MLNNEKLIIDVDKNNIFDLDKYSILILWDIYTDKKELKYSIKNFIKNILRTHINTIQLKSWNN